MKLGRFIVDYPFQWIKDGDVGCALKNYFNNLLKILVDSGMRVEIISTEVGNDFVRRNEEEDAIIIRYHAANFPLDLSFRRTLYVKETSFKDVFSIDPLGYAGFSLPAIRPELYCNHIESRGFGYFDLIRDELERGISKYPQPPEGEWGYRDYIFFPLQLVDDAVAALANISVLELLKFVLNEAPRDRLVVIKDHPRQKSAMVALILSELAQLENVIITDRSTRQLISACDCVLTVNSSVGFEAIMHGRPVYHTGRSEWGVCGNFVGHVSGLGSVFRRNSDIDMEKVRCFVDGLFYRSYSKCDDFRSIERTFFEALSLSREFYEV